MSQFVSTSRHCRDIHYKNVCLEWDIAETLMLETLTLELSSSVRSFMHRLSSSLIISSVCMHFTLKRSIQVVIDRE